MMETATATRRDERGAHVAQEPEHHQDHQRPGNEQCTSTCSKSRGSGGAIDDHRQVDGTGQGRLQLRQEARG